MNDDQAQSVSHLLEHQWEQANDIFTRMNAADLATQRAVLEHYLEPTPPAERTPQERTGPVSLIPAVLAHPLHSRSGGFSVKCPYCHKGHKHGGALGEREALCQKGRYNLVAQDA